MFRILAAILLALSTLPAAADEVFATYADYEAFVDTKIKNREFSNVINRLGVLTNTLHSRCKSCKVSCVTLFRIT